MVRMILGSIAAAVAMFVIGFIFFATPLSGLGMGHVDDGQAAAVKQTLATSLPQTGTYQVPGTHTQAQTNMYSQGPIATIHYHTDGFAGRNLTGGIWRLVLYFVVALLMAAALLGIERRVPDLGSRARVSVIIAVAASAFTHLAKPTYWHHDWGNAIYMFVGDSLALAAAGLILAWFLPASRNAAPEDAPKEV